MKRYLKLLTAAVMSVSCLVLLSAAASAKNTYFINEPDEVTINKKFNDTATEGTGEVIYTPSNTKFSGETVNYDLEVTRAKYISGMWQQSKSFAIRSAINQGSSYTLADMAYINNNFVLTNGGQILNIIGLAGDESYFKIHIEMDLPNAKYRVSAFKTDGTGELTSEWEEIPGASRISDWSKAAVGNVSVLGNDVKTGSYIKIKNVQLYYNDGNIDLFDNPTEYTVNKSGLIYEDLASENVTGETVIYEADVTRAALYTGNWDGAQVASIRANFKGTTGGYSITDLAYINTSFVLTKGGQKVRIIELAKDSTQEGEKFFRLRIEMDIPNQRYRIVARDLAETREVSSDWEEIPNRTDAYAITDWNTAYVYNVGVWGTATAEKSSVTFKNAVLYYTPTPETVPMTATTYDNTDTYYLFNVTFNEDLSNNNIYLAAFDTDGKLLCVKSVDYDADGTEVAVNVSELTNVKTVKVLTWNSDLVPAWEGETLSMTK